MMVNSAKSLCNRWKQQVENLKNTHGSHWISSYSYVIFFLRWRLTKERIVLFIFVPISLIFSYFCLNIWEILSESHRSAISEVTLLIYLIYFELILDRSSLMRWSSDPWSYWSYHHVFFLMMCGDLRTCVRTSVISTWYRWYIAIKQLVPPAEADFH